MMARGSLQAGAAGMVALLVAAACLTTEGCLWRRQRAAPRKQEPPAADVTFQVINHNYLDVVVYVLHDGQRTRIGMVTGSSTQDFALPPRLLGQAGEIQLYGDPIGSTDFALTELLFVQPGQHIEWTLESDLRRSSVGVY